MEKAYRFFTRNILASSPWLSHGQHQHSHRATIWWRARTTRIATTEVAGGLPPKLTAAEPLLVDLLRARVRDDVRRRHDSTWAMLG